MNLTNKEKKRIRFLTGIFGWVCLLIGGAFAFDWESLTKEMYDIYKYGPIVQIACDVPNQELNVTMTVDTDGKSELYFIPHGEAGPINVWLYVVDFYAPFSWRILENTESITLYSLNEHSYAAYPSSAVSGEGQAVAFRMHFQEGEYAISRIALQPMNGRQFLREKEASWFRLPYVCPWVSSDPEDIYTAYDNGGYFNDPKFISKTIDGATLYLSSLSILASAPNHAYVNPGLVLESVSPETTPKGYYFLWRCNEFFSPLVQYTDITWQTAFERKGAVAGLFFGLGTSCLWMVHQHPIKKGRKQR